MSNPLTFTKMHAAGNDFVVLDLTKHDWQPGTQSIISLSDKRKGIGFDQLLLIGPPENESVDFDLTIFNSDGSVAEQCGNGTACVAKFVRDKTISTKRRNSFQTLGGLVRTRFVRASNSREDLFEVELGIPQFEPENIPFVSNAKSLSYDVQVGNDVQIMNLTPMSLGNPHAIVFVPKVDLAAVESVGRAIQIHPSFPKSTNVEFVEIIDRKHIKLRIFERGAGETMACGSGACASTIAARMHDLVDPTIHVEQRGGTVEVSWLNVDSPVKINVTAVQVYEGII